MNRRELAIVWLIAIISLAIALGAAVDFVQSMRRLLG